MSEHIGELSAESADEVVPPHRYASSAAWRNVDKYYSDLLVAEDDALIAARHSGSQTTMPNAEVAANQGALLGLIAQISGARRVLEFGTLAGYSTICLARAVGDGGKVVTLEVERQNAEIARANLDRAGVSYRVDIVLGPAVESTRQLIDEATEPFDFVFIDADKPSNPAYLAAAVKLTRSGAVIIIDNVVRDGAVVDGNSDDARVIGVRTVTEDIAAHPDLEATAIQTVGEKGWDGFILIRRR